jgi:hypothetical protein
VWWLGLIHVHLLLSLHILSRGGLILQLISTYGLLLTFFGHLQNTFLDCLFDTLKLLSSIAMANKLIKLGHIFFKDLLHSDKFIPIGRLGLGHLLDLSDIALLTGLRMMLKVKRAIFHELMICLHLLTVLLLLELIGFFHLARCSL